MINDDVNQLNVDDYINWVEHNIFRSLEMYTTARSWYHLDGRLQEKNSDENLKHIYDRMKKRNEELQVLNKNNIYETYMLILYQNHSSITTIVIEKFNRKNFSIYYN